MAASWDPLEAAGNLRKHGVRFSDAEGALFDPFGLTLEDEGAEGEQRLVTIGSDALGRIVVVVHTLRGDDLRIISARRATKAERGLYEERVRLQ